MIIGIKNIDWAVLRAEYLAGASYRNIADKHHIAKSTVYAHAKDENWLAMRRESADAARIASIQKTAELAADNAGTAARIKAKLLMRLEREIDALPQLIGTEQRSSEETRTYDADDNLVRRRDKTCAYKLRDLTAAYRDLTDDMPKGAGDVEDLTPLAEMLRDE